MYELSYRPSVIEREFGQLKRTAPAVLVSIAAEDLPLFDRQLNQVLLHSCASPMSKVRLRQRTGLSKTKLGNFCRGKTFGFDEVGCEHAEGDRHVFELCYQGRKKLHALGLTAEVLFETLRLFRSKVNERRVSNLPQLLAPSVFYLRGIEKAYQIAVEADAGVLLRLRSLYALLPEQEIFGDSTRLVPEVSAAMADAFRAAHYTKERAYAKGCVLAVHEDGRFEFRAFGGVCGMRPNAPDYMRPESGLPSRASADNTDAPIHQMVILAGIAALHDLVAKDLS